jgi:molecular chaperone GrpE
MLEDLLPVLDAFDAAFTGAAWEKVDGNWRIGIEYIHSQFKKVLEENGVKPFEALGATFDPMKHDPAGEEETEDKPVGTIAKVLRQGYEIGGRVIRPSRVIVFKSKE